MLQIIIGCIIGNLITIILILSLSYYLGKNKILSIKENISKLITEIQSSLEEIKSTINKGL